MRPCQYADKYVSCPAAFGFMSVWKRRDTAASEGEGKGKVKLQRTVNKISFKANPSISLSLCLLAVYNSPWSASTVCTVLINNY